MIAPGHSADKSELRVSWRVLLAATVGTGLGFPGLLFYTVGIFAPVLAKEFGWSYGGILAGLALTPIAILCGGPIVGWAVDKFGPRKIASLSLLAVGLAYGTLALSNGSLTQYYISWGLLTLCGLGATPISFTRAVNHAFVARRGMALGITLAGIGLFALCIKPFGTWLLQATDWRTAIVIVGLLPALIGAPLVWWGFPDAVRSQARRSALGRPAQLPGLTLKESLRTRAFWIMAIAFVPMAFASGSPVPNLENILRTLHLPADEIVMLSSLIGFAMVAGRLLGGWLMDRIWAPLMGFIVLCGGAFACWQLSQGEVSTAQAMLAILLLGFAGGVEVDLLSFLVARYLGMRSYGVVYGLIYGLFALGAGGGPSLLGWFYDRTGTYSQILQICAGLLIAVALLLLALGRYPEHKSAPSSAATAGAAG